MKNPLEIMLKLEPVFLTHFQSSGLVYLHSLFDGHRQILTIPGIPNLDTLYSAKLKNTDDALDRFNEANPKFFDTSQMAMTDLNNAGLFRLGENADEGIKTDKDAFENFFRCFMQNSAVTGRNVILGLYYAYAMAHNQNLGNKKIILYHPHLNKKALALYRFFPEAKLIVTIRDPERAYVSRYNLMRDKAKIRNLVFSHFGLLSDLAINIAPLAEHNIPMKIVRVEDFKLDSKVMLSELCEFMNIEYDNALEKSSFGGKKFWGANLKYRANKFDNTRHVPMLNLPKKERRIFSLISLRFNRAVGYGGIDLTPLEKTMAFAYLLVPMQWDIKWFKEDFRLKELLKLFYERIKIVFIYYRNLTAHRQYEIMRKSLINCKKGFDQR